MKIENQDWHQVRMVAHETDERLFRAFLTIRHSEEAHVTRQCGTNIGLKRLGHNSDEILMTSLKQVCGINAKDVRGHERIQCDTCALSKLARSSLKTLALEDQCATKPLDPVCMDIDGPIRHLSLGEVRYFVTLLHFYSCSSLATLRHREIEAEDAVIPTLREVGNLFNSRLRRITTIN